MLPFQYTQKNQFRNSRLRTQIFNNKPKIAARMLTQYIARRVHKQTWRRLIPSYKQSRREFICRRAILRRQARFIVRSHTICLRDSFSTILARGLSHGRIYVRSPVYTDTLLYLSIFIWPSMF